MSASEGDFPAEYTRRYNLQEAGDRDEHARCDEEIEGFEEMSDGKNEDDLPMPPLTRLRTREEDSSEEEESDAESLPASPVRRASGRLAQQPAPKAPAPKRARAAGKKKGVERFSQRLRLAGMRPRERAALRRVLETARRLARE